MVADKALEIEYDTKTRICWTSSPSDYWFHLIVQRNGIASVGVMGFLMALLASVIDPLGIGNICQAY